MSSLVISTLWSCNVYLNGMNLLGRAAEIEIPHPKRIMKEYKGLGMAMMLKIPTGWQNLEAQQKWQSFDEQTITALCNSETMTTLSALGDLQVLSSAGEVAELPVIYNITGIISDAGKVSFKAQDNVEYQSTMEVWHSELYIGGNQIFFIDAASNQFMVGGVDQLAAFRANQGG
jgi:P2 family phage contractile tail tube protein